MAVMIEILNGRLVEGGATAEPAGARGVFETALLAQGRPVFFGEHLARFAAGCAHFGLAQAPSAAALWAAAADLVQRTGLAEGVVRWAAWTDGPAEAWRLRVEPPRPRMLVPAWRVAVSPLRLPPADADHAFKHLGRKRWGEALAVGRAAGCDEVILADGAGYLIEGAISNLFWVRGGAVATPPVADGPLPGIVRAKVLELARAEGVPVREERAALAELALAEEIFLTNSLVGVRAAAVLDGRRLSAPGPVTRRLQAAWRRLHGWGG
jgi:branched-subunit amino acid aminotransferase/4-amino-4-deoxychorismate lyase